MKSIYIHLVITTQRFDKKIKKNLPSPLCGFCMADVVGSEFKIIKQ